ncbi:hypothetical protein [Novosphingobium terrae]|uniref:hypothetical protein n=1 Tax=Novosphingobium terrae TaxID=2726189 RepID=UPI001F142B9E|nr:hypothetical protein [Novosphingobium terrae]
MPAGKKAALFGSAVSVGLADKRAASGAIALVIKISRRDKPMNDLLKQCRNATSVPRQISRDNGFIEQD